MTEKPTYEELEKRIQQLERVASDRKPLEEPPRSSETRLMEEELLFKNVLLKAQSEATIDGILVVDTMGNVILSNNRMREMWKVPRQTWGTGVDEKLLEHAVALLEKPEEFLEKVKYLYDHKEEKSRDEIALKDGRTFDRYSSPVIDEQNKYHGRVWYFRDITERKQMEDALRRNHDLLEERVKKRTAELEGSNERLMTEITTRKQAEEEKLALERRVQHAHKLESLGVLAGGIAHDFNNILMAVLGNAELALEELSPTSPTRNYLEEIEAASRRAVDLAGQMLAYSGRGRFVIEPIDIGELIKEMAHLLEASISKKALLKYNIADDLPPFDGDATQIRQVIMNLVINASEAIDDSSGTITLSTGSMDCTHDELDDVNMVLHAGLDEPLPEGVYTYLEVADTGRGIDAEIIDKIFDPFFTTKFTGRGLGMSAALGIMRGHKGVLKVQSSIGKGTTFKILFPAKESSKKDFTSRREVGAEEKGWRGSGTVLIADDEKAVCTVGKRMLERIGFSVLAAPDGREAVEVFRKHADEIVCVLLDLTMPHLDGVETFREMQRIRPDVQVILCSGYNEQDATQHFAGRGLAGFIQKPYKLSLLQEKLRIVLEKDK